MHPLWVPDHDPNRNTNELTKTGWIILFLVAVIGASVFLGIALWFSPG